MNTQAAIQNIPSFESYEQILAPDFEENINPSDDLGSYCSDVFPYLEPQELSSGDQHQLEESINLLLDDAKYCGKVGMKGKGWTTQKLYVAMLTCKRWWCDVCGAAGEYLHMKRFARVKEVWGEITKKSAIQQVVLTVPPVDRHLYKSLAGLDKFQAMAWGYMKTWFPGRPEIQFFHGFGEKHPGELHPHIQCGSKPDYGKTVVFSPEKLKAMRLDWGERLRKNGGQHEGDVDIDYSWARGVEQVTHKLKYMCRPWPGPADRKAMWLNNRELLYFFMVTLRKFKYMRSHGWKRKEKKKAKEVGELKGYEILAGEKITWDRNDRITRAEFRMLYLDLRDEKLAPGFYRINGP